MNGQQKWRETGENLKAKAFARVAQEETAETEVEMELDQRRQLAVQVQGIEVTSEVADIFKATSDMGMENVSQGSLPQLKVTEVNSKDRLFDGSKPPAGKFFYAPTKELYDEVEVSILTVSRGFWTTVIDIKTNEPKRNPDGTAQTRFNQLVGGLMMPTMQPFVIFAAGTRWKAMNDFVKSIKPLTKHKTSPIPMYAFRVMLISELISTSGGNENHIIKYSLIRNDKNQAQINSNKNTIDVLLAGIDPLTEAFDSFISVKEVDRFSGELLANQVQEVSTHQFERKVEASEVNAQAEATFNAITQENIDSNPFSTSEEGSDIPPF